MMPITPFLPIISFQVVGVPANMSGSIYLAHWLRRGRWPMSCLSTGQVPVLRLQLLCGSHSICHKATRRPHGIYRTSWARCRYYNTLWHDSMWGFLWHDLHICQEINSWRPGSWFDMKILSYPYRKYHCVDKMVIWSSYLHNGIYLYW